MVFGTQMQATARALEPSRVLRIDAAAILRPRRRLAGVLARRSATLALERLGGLQGIAAEAPEAAGRPSSASAGTRPATSSGASCTRNQITFEGITLDDPDTAGELGARCRRRASCPALRLADGTTLFRPDTRDARRARSASAPRPSAARLRHGDHRRRPRRPRRRGLRRLRGPAHPGRRARGARRAGRDLVADRELPRLPQRHLRRRARRPGAAPGPPARRRDPDHPPDHARSIPRPAPSTSTATRRSTPAPSSSPPASTGAGSPSRASTG